MITKITATDNKINDNKAGKRTTELSKNNEGNTIKLTADFAIDGGSVTVTLNNSSKTDVVNWDGAFVIEHGQLSSSWGVSDVKTTPTKDGGTKVTASPVAWNQVIPAGQSVSFGFQMTGTAVDQTDFTAVVLGPPIPGKGFPPQFFAPYVDVLVYPTFSLIDDYKQSGQKYYTLAFITADNKGNPTWGGTIPLLNYHYSDQINAIRQAGGDIIISFGGANGTPIDAASANANELAAKYIAVIEAYNLTRIDLDVEGTWIADKKSIALRNQALKMVQTKYPKLKIGYCLPVLPTGLTADGLYVLQNAIAAKVEIDVVNAMSMDFGDSAAPNPDHKMADYIIQSAQSVHDQLQVLYPQHNDRLIWSMVGITPMLGQNDAIDEVVWQDDAQKILKFAQVRGLHMLAMWSSSRDNGDKRDQNASPTHSGIIQASFEFTKIFLPFSGSCLGLEKDLNGSAVACCDNKLISSMMFHSALCEVLLDKIDKLIESYMQQSEKCCCLKMFFRPQISEQVLNIQNLLSKQNGLFSAEEMVSQIAKLVLNKGWDTRDQKLQGLHTALVSLFSDGSRKQLALEVMEKLEQKQRSSGPIRDGKGSTNLAISGSQGENDYSQTSSCPPK